MDIVALKTRKKITVILLVLVFVGLLAYGILSLADSQIQGTVLKQSMFPIFMGIGTAIYGIVKERHFVAPISIVLTIFNIGTSLFFTPVPTPSFWITLMIYGIGVIVIWRDIHKTYQKWWVAYSLGNKTIGAITLFEGLIQNNLIMNPFTPMFSSAFQTISQNDPNFTIYVHVFAFGLIIVIIYIIGIVTKIIFPKKKIL